ncbi:dynamin family protein [Asanoa sp. WMMD1127]|uniref:dynamin family protein n=1 Tax=Asanoa sp. WMMD1127 TaxID=3016107 RepID=UPI002416799C|nr:dynamin family protein [Asanoa sp. WMMD1127]MDG4822729.1 dynamin family protein [Asanoa sp. WMMD1127]
MTEPATATAPATALVDLGIKACTAYGREDLAARLGRLQAGLADPAVHIVVAGEFKQGKSSLINALLGTAVCPVDDDVATAVPTFVRHGAEKTATVVHEGNPPRREQVDFADLRRHVVEGHEGARASRVDVTVPRKILSGGLVMVDTPGVGGLGSAHAAAGLAAISLADAVLFVTDAAQELTRSEVEFLRQARELCSTVVCVLTKIDFYPAWRRIRDLNAGHLRMVGEIPLLPVSSPLRARAVRANNQALNVESGFPDLVKFVQERVGGGAAARRTKDAAAEVLAVCDQLRGQFTAERDTLADPANAQRIVDDLNTAKRRVEELKTAAARWSVTLNDGTADLTADVDFDLRDRIRKITTEADDAIDEVDPADMWPEMEEWLRARISYDLLGNYTYLRRRATELSEQVAEHFQEASGEAIGMLKVYNPTPIVEERDVEHRIELAKMTAGKQVMVALKSAYGGALMFTMLGSLMGVALGPIGIGIGVVMGHRGLKDEKKRQLERRRAQGKNAMRRYCDEISFVTGKDSRDTVRRVQRQLRDHYTQLADELNRSTATALAAATDTAKRSQADRQKRLKDLEAELTRLGQLRDRALKLGAA